MYQNLTSNISKSREHTLLIFMSFFRSNRGRGIQKWSENRNRK